MPRHPTAVQNRQATSSTPFPTPLPKGQVTSAELNTLRRLRDIAPAQNPPKPKLSLGARVADKVAATMGSWHFIIIQSIVLAIWVTLNVTALVKQWDPYPFILLNLMLSFQAAYAAPIIMMSQNRQSDVDRAAAKHDYEVNLKSELEIELLHDKINTIREADIPALIQTIQLQKQQLDKIEQLLTKGS